MHSLAARLLREVEVFPGEHRVVEEEEGDGRPLAEGHRSRLHHILRRFLAFIFCFHHLLNIISHSFGASFGSPLCSAG